MSSLIDSWLFQYFDEVAPKEFYRDIFPKGELENTGDTWNTGSYTGIIVSVSSTEKRQKCRKQKKNDGSCEWEPVFESDGTPKMEPVVRRYYLTDDLNILDRLFKSNDFCLMSPLSYAGRERSAKNARFMYAMAFDLDCIRMKDEQPVGLMNLWNGHIEAVGRIPKPTYIVSSGSGVHLYYVFKQAIPLFENVVKQLQRMKHELTEMIWNEGIVELKDEKKIEYEGIYQGFRVPGTVTKNGDRARVFLTGDKIDLEYMNGFVENKVTDYVYKSKLTRAAAKVKYPEWYQERIVEGKKGVLHPWAVSRNLYDWWKREIMRKAYVGKRYWCLMLLSTLAVKCSHYDEKKNPNPVTFDELERDAFEIMEYFETLTVEEDNHFTEIDVLDALDAFDGEMVTFPRSSIQYRCGFSLPQNKRNGQKQAEHLEEARAIRDIRQKRKGTKWTDGNGRPTKEDVVRVWQIEHPDGTKTQCMRDTGLSKPTVLKWWVEFPHGEEK